MAGRKIRDEKDARQCMAAAKRTGLSRAQWARQHGIDGRSLFAWGKNLEQGDKARASQKSGQNGKRRTGLLELVAQSTTTPSRYIVRCGHVAIEIDEHFDEDVLARVLKVVAAC